MRKTAAMAALEGVCEESKREPCTQPFPSRGRQVVGKLVGWSVAPDRLFCSVFQQTLQSACHSPLPPSRSHLSKSLAAATHCSSTVNSSQKSALEDRLRRTSRNRLRRTSRNRLRRTSRTKEIAVRLRGSVKKASAMHFSVSSKIDQHHNCA